MKLLSNKYKIKDPIVPTNPRMKLLSEVFGREHPMLWLLPCSSTKRKLDTPLIDHHV
jgi:hypothetical protein